MGGDSAPAPTAKDEEDPLPQTTNSPARSVKFAGSSGSKSPQRSLQPRKKSFVDRTAKFSDDVSSKDRDGHMDRLLKDKRKSMRMLFPDQADSCASLDEDEEMGADGDLSQSVETSMQKKEFEEQSEFVRSLQQIIDGMPGGAGAMGALPDLEIRLKNFSFKVPSRANCPDKDGIATVATPLYKMKATLKKYLLYHKREKKEKQVTNVLSNVNLVLKPGKMYLVLGPPQSGKTSLLKAIGGSLPQGDFPSGYKEKKYLTGQVIYNNLVCCGEGADSSNENLFKNLVAFVSQHDTHAPRLTVGETFVFSGCSKDESIRLNRKGTCENGKVGLTLKGLGLSHVKDTFVGNEQIRGVSGGQRRRVTLGEMLVFDTPLLCGDEISTGLDTASTVDILRILSYTNRLFRKISVVSLLQPSPEAVAMFDDVILLSEGHVIYAGSTRNAGEYFRNLGYRQPDSMDDADYLLAVASTDRKLLATGENHSAEMLATVYEESWQHANIKAEQEKDWKDNWAVVTGSKAIPKRFMQKYQNPFSIGVLLNLRRFFTLWTRDKIFIRASVIKNVAMGLSVGFVFLNTTLDSSYFGVLFQGNLFIMLGAMTAAPEKVDARAVFYKHADSNFYSALSYVIGEALAAMPQMLIDVLLFGIFVYWMVGFVPSAASFIIYLLLFFLFTFSMGQTMGLLASVASTKTVVQGGGAVVLLMNVLFSGYIVAPNVIPIYWNWIYWITPLSWIYRSLLLNEFVHRSDGQQVMESYGFLLPNDTPYGREWIGYGFAYIIPYTIICLVASAYCLHRFRMEAKQGGTSDIAEEKDEVECEVSESNTFNEESFIPVDLSFNNLCYDVKASKGSDKLRLLKNVSGVFSSGRLCALMGESGAGKTTLMDVIALRKGGGEISGEVLLNGFSQEKVSFRRCSGYVEQFDVQSAELTIRETIRFSAELRLDRTHPARTSPAEMDQHVNEMIAMFELQKQADVLVGNEEEGGLTFEQKKRLSIAVELAASPSVLFLDEPTSGLDSRAALLVMNCLRKITDTGRTIVATIHQPSSQVFDMFDDLLLLKKGGEVVFYGETGVCSSNLISYFEGLGVTPMNTGENPATWMLNVLGEHISAKGQSDGEDEVLSFATAWNQSSNCADLANRFAEINETRDEEMEIKFDSTFPVGWFKRDNLMGNRLVKIYWRSPAYNLARMALSVLIALLLGSMFIPIRNHLVFSEAEITSVLATIFISFIIIGVLSIVSVLPVMLNVRDMFYRHKAAGMLNYWSLGRALGTAEHRFILIASFLFCIMFIPVSGLAQNPDLSLRSRVLSAVSYWGFFTFNSAIYSYIGQLFMCLVRGQGTAMVLASVFIGINNFFSGFIVRPQQMIGNFWVITYIINPGHYVYEGLVTSAFWNDYRTVIVTNASQYYVELTSPGYVGQNNTLYENGVCEVMDDGSYCEVTANEFVYAFFGQQYGRRNIPRNVIVLACILVGVRIFTFLALRNLTYSGK